jgi:hypothetical protein
MPSCPPGNAGGVGVKFMAGTAIMKPYLLVPAPPCIVLLFVGVSEYKCALFRNSVMALLAVVKCETLPSKASPHTSTRLGVGLA